MSKKQPKAKPDRAAKIAEREYANLHRSDYNEEDWQYFMGLKDQLARKVRKYGQDAATRGMLAERGRIMGDLDGVLRMFGTRSPEYRALMMVRNAIQGPMSGAPTKGAV